MITRAGVMSASETWKRSRPPRYPSSERRSFHLTMKDGAKLAVDLHLPVGLGDARIPTIVRQTRYFRSMDVAPWFARLAGEARIDPINAALRALFVARGYAWLDVDVRGSGASSGVWHSPWSPLEVADGAELLDFVVRQPWSNGKVGATGNSYDGTAAEMMAVNGHPALRAIAPRCSLFDVYTDNAYPGGVRQSWFIRAWNTANQALDGNHPEEMVALALGVAHPRLQQPRVRRAFLHVVRRLLRGVRPVDSDESRSALEAAIAEHHANLDVFGAAGSVEHRDDVHPSPLGPRTVDAFSPATFRDELRRSGVAVLGIGAWFDAAYQHAAIKRHLTLSPGQCRLVLGPWNHGVGFNASPHAKDTRPGFDLGAELLRFFDHHLLGADTGLDREAPVRAYTMGAESWTSLSEWPPRDGAPTSWSFDRERTLSASPRAPEEGTDVLPLDPDAGSGPRSRWRTLVSPFLLPSYPDQGLRSQRRSVYRSAPLTEDVTFTGHPLLVLFLRATAADGALFAYLEEEAPDGRVSYVTEGQLRLCHHRAHPGVTATEAGGEARLFRSPAPYRPFTRASASPLTPGELYRIELDLLPTSFRFSRGGRIRVALAGTDVDHFDAVPGAARELALARGGAHRSELVLPAARSG